MQLDRLTGIEKWRELKIARWSYRGAIKRCPQQFDLNGSRIYRAYRNFLDRSRSCQTTIETNFQKPQWIEIAITAIKKRSSRG